MLYAVHIVFIFVLMARMENSVLGNALDGVPEESEEEEQPSNPNIESANNLDGQYLKCCLVSDCMLLPTKQKHIYYRIFLDYKSHFSFILWLGM